MATSEGECEKTASTGRKSISSFHCCFPCCNGDSRYHRELIFHRLPGRGSHGEQLKKDWLVKIRRDEGPYFRVTSSTRVCSRHFTADDYLPATEAGRQRLKRGAVPSQFDWTKGTKARRKIIRHEDKDTQTDGSDDSDEATEPLREEDDIRSLKDQLEELKLQLHHSKQETAAARQELLTAQLCHQTEMEQLKKDTAEQLALGKFGLERFGTDNDSIRFYTGFPSYDSIRFFYTFIRPSAEQMVYCYASGQRETRPGARNMLLIDELFMFLVRLKLGLFEQDLAHRFQVHRTTVSRKLVSWSNFLYFLLGSQIIWPTKEDVMRFMPDGFKRLYPRTRVILDCTEIFVQTPTSLLLQSQFYSSYKSNTTLKGLIGITPNGAVSFVSNLYTGAISDKEITRCSGILDLLEEGDAVMADKGFNIGDLLKEKKVDLNIPPFLQNQNQFSARDVQKTKAIASLRIHVERAIRRVKEYHFFDSDVPLATLGSINQIYTVACLLTNFQGPLILSEPTNQDN